MKVVVGLGSCGIAAGARKVYEKLEDEVKNGLDIDLEITGCVGMCHLEPIVDIYYDDHNFDRFVKVKEDEILELINNAKEKNILEEKKIAAEDEEALTKQVRIAIENCGLINPERIEEYISKGGY
ncbi:hypothetical protein P7M38_24970, partial [Vibrio parahaemolyticus]|nr:hypothetical protein [Vibrio parahaemolyticus]